MKKVLTVGESWTVQETHIKGFDTVDLGRLEQTSAEPLLNALKNAGIDNKARYAMTPLAKILPVEMLNYDDRMEHPEGITPQMVKPEHPVLAGITGEWPWFLGYNKIKAKAEEIAVIDEGDTFMAGMECGKGRTFAFASDCAMHWGSKEFLAWDGYQKLIPNIFRWLAREI